MMTPEICQNMMPPVRGNCDLNVPLAPLTTIKVGGPADILFTPTNLGDFQAFWQQKPANLPVTLLGEGSNVMIHDGGIRGVVVRLNPGLTGVAVLPDHQIRAEAGATSGKVARTAREAGLTGVEFLCGIPGSIGGALMMNAGAYGDETVDHLTQIEVLDNSGTHRTLTPEDFDFRYRHSGLPAGWVFVAATFTLKPGDKQHIRARMREINKNRTASQPLNMPSSGSWFKNPKRPDLNLNNAWQAVDQAGCRGLQYGQAQVSEKHSNFFVNLGGATAADMIALSERVEAKINQKFGIEMVREVKIIGEPGLS